MSRYALSVQDRPPSDETKRQLDACRRERLQADAMILAARCALLAAEIDSLSLSADVPTCNSLHMVATEVRRADTSLRSIVHLSKTTTGEPR